MPPPSAATTKTGFDGGSAAPHRSYDVLSDGSAPLAASAAVAAVSGAGRTSWLSFQKLNTAAHASAMTSIRTFHASEANTTSDPNSTVLAAAMNRMASAPRWLPAESGWRTNQT